VADRILSLNQQLKKGLASMRHVRLHTPVRPDLSAGFVCFEVDGLSPSDVVQRLRDRKVIASATAYPTPYARFAAGIPNTDGDIERALAHVRDLAKA
jgi:isopenicillin-N epimerase